MNKVAIQLIEIFAHREKGSLFVTCNGYEQTVEPAQGLAQRNLQLFVTFRMLFGIDISGVEGLLT